MCWLSQGKQNNYVGLGNNDIYIFAAEGARKIRALVLLETADE